MLLLYPGELYRLLGASSYFYFFYFIFFSRNNDSIFDELSCQDADIIGDVDFGADITGKIHVFTVECYRLTRCFVYDLYLQVF